MQLDAAIEEARLLGRLGVTFARERRRPRQGGRTQARSKANRKQSSKTRHERNPTTTISGVGRECRAGGVPGFRIGKAGQRRVFRFHDFGSHTISM